MVSPRMIVVRMLLLVAGSFTKTPLKSGSYTDNQKKGCIDLHINCAAAVHIHLRLTDVLDPGGLGAQLRLPGNADASASESVSNAMLLSTPTTSTIINGKAILSLSLCPTSIFLSETVDLGRLSERSPQFNSSVCQGQCLSASCSVGRQACESCVLIKPFAF